MSRTSKRKRETEGEVVEFNLIREKIRKAIDEKYGSVADFLSTDFAKKLGGSKIRPYLYETGAVNFDLISTLSSHFGIGELSRSLVVTRSYTYTLKTD